MLQPKRVKFRKSQRGRMEGNANSGNTVVFGDFGLKAMAPAWITARQIEAARRAITRHFRRGGQVWVRVFPDKPVSKKPLETRQGGGKAPTDRWVAVVRPGRILFEVGGVPEETARRALYLAAMKLPIPMRTLSREARQEAATSDKEQDAHS
ncbi:MAG: 50S ribosomal protein L16 [Chloroflexota bacterium]